MTAAIIGILLAIIILLIFIIIYNQKTDVPPQARDIPEQKQGSQAEPEKKAQPKTVIETQDGSEKPQVAPTPTTSTATSGETSPPSDDTPQDLGEQ